MAETTIEEWLETARYIEQKDGTFVGQIPNWLGFFIYGKTLEECQANLKAAARALVNRKPSIIYLDDKSFQNALDEIPNDR